MGVVVPSAAPARRAGSASTAAADLYQRRLAAAIAWRRDHAADLVDRDRLWRCYRTGAAWTVRDHHERVRRAMQAALDAAADEVPFTTPGR